MHDYRNQQAAAVSAVMITIIMQHVRPMGSGYDNHVSVQLGDRARLTVLLRVNTAPFGLL